MSTNGPHNKHRPSHNAAGHRQWRGIGTLQGTCDTERLSILMIHKSPISTQASADSRIDLGAMGRTLAVTALVPKPQFRGDGGVMGRADPGLELGFRLGVTLWQQASWQQASWQRASWRLAFSRARPRP